MIALVTRFCVFVYECVEYYYKYHVDLSAPLMPHHTHDPLMLIHSNTEISSSTPREKSFSFAYAHIDAFCVVEYDAMALTHGVDDITLTLYTLHTKSFQNVLWAKV